MSRSLGLASLESGLHIQNASTDRGHLHRGVERIKRKKERGRGTDIKRVTDIKTETKGGTETETETGDGKRMTDTEAEKTTGIEGKTETEIGTEVEATIEVEEGGIQRDMGRGTGALKKERGIRMVKERRGGIQLKTSGRTKIRRKRRKEGRNQRRR